MYKLTFLQWYFGTTYPRQARYFLFQIEAKQLQHPWIAFPSHPPYKNKFSTNIPRICKFIRLLMLNMLKYTIICCENLYFFQAQQTPALLWGVFNRLYPNVHQGISSSSMDYSWFFPVITGTKLCSFQLSIKTLNSSHCVGGGGSEGI